MILAAGSSITVGGTLSPAATNNAVGTFTVVSDINLASTSTLAIDVNPTATQTTGLLAETGALSLNGGKLAINA